MDAVRPAAHWRVMMGVLCSVPVLLFSSWLLHLWWCGFRLDSDLEAFCRQDRRGDAQVRREFVAAISQVSRLDYEAGPEALRPICAWAVADMPPAPELLQWPKRARINADWKRYQAGLGQR